MKFIIHDLPLEDPATALFTDPANLVIPATGPKAPCKGCFGCWLKTPGKCILKDRIKDMGKNLASCKEFIIVTKCIYGCFAPETKNMIDRSISYLLPFFRNVHHMQHHVPRYKQQFKLEVFVYNSPDLADSERDLFERYVNAVAINMNVTGHDINFLNSASEVFA